MLAELAKREEVKRTGVYCLLGPDPENPARDKVYLGEGDNVFKRLTAHDDDESKEFGISKVESPFFADGHALPHTKYVSLHVVWFFVILVLQLCANWD